MNQIVPPSLLFDFELSIPRCPAPSKKKTGRLLSLPKKAELFVPSAMNGTPIFATLSAGWNEDGFAVSVNVKGKPDLPLGMSADVKRSDAVLLWIDTRTTGDVHRATEYCHHFACLPVDEHHDGKPAVVVQQIAQQRMQRIESDPQKMVTRTHVSKTGYELEVWIPGTQLYGYREIAEIGRLGFYCVVQDSHLGEQPLSLSDDFPTSYDPSTWPTLKLQS